VTRFNVVGARGVPLELIWMLFCLYSCYAPQPQPTPSGPATAPRTYPYEMSESAKAQFLTDLRTLHAGDSLDNVVKRMGQPDSEGLIQAKGYDEPVRGRWICYCWRHPNKEPNENQDQYVFFSFDTAGQLVSVSGNVPAATTAARVAGLVAP